MKTVGDVFSEIRRPDWAAVRLDEISGIEGWKPDKTVLHTRRQKPTKIWVHKSLEDTASILSVYGTFFKGLTPHSLT